MKRDKHMDAIVVVFVLIIALAIVGLILWFRYQDHVTSLYERRLKAESEYDARIMNAAKTLTIGKFAYITRGVNRDGLIIYDVKTLSDQGGAVASNAIPADVTVHQLAVEWVMMSMRAAPDGSQLLSESKVRSAGLISDPNKWVEVGNYLRDNFGVVKINNRGNENGTYTKSGTTLKDLLLSLSVASLSPAPPRELVA